MVARLDVTEQDVSEAMIELFSEARLPEEPRLREIVGEIAMGIVDTIDRAFSADADPDGEGEPDPGGWN